MKRIFLSLALGTMAFSLRAQVQPIMVNANQKRVQIAILFDTSNSMDGLIEQAKSRIWAIVNTMSNLRYNGQVPFIEIALYDYGNDNIPNKDFVRNILPMSSDLDLVSQKLFALTTRGGDEYCGAVISHALQELTWSMSPNDLKMIYIAGNEPFNQGNVYYKDVCKIAVQRDIQVNTIYCGDYQQGITEFWYDGAQTGKGEYSNINPNLQVVQYKSPYDDRINAYNDSLNRTYIQYGYEGELKKENQSTQDNNALKQSVSAKTERAIVKSKAAYNNASWDIVDAVGEKTLKLEELKEDELPDEMKGKTTEEKQKYIEEKRLERVKFQKAIQELSLEREKYITEEKAKTPEAASDLGEEINKNIIKVATEKGFVIEK